MAESPLEGVNWIGRLASCARVAVFALMTVAFAAPSSAQEAATPRLAQPMAPATAVAAPASAETPAPSAAADIDMKSSRPELKAVPGVQPAASAKAGEHDLSPMGMFRAADPVVKGVMILLAACSVITWTVLLEKSVGLWRARRNMRRAIPVLRNARDLQEAGGLLETGAAATLLREAAEEAQLSQGLSAEGVKERVQMALFQAQAIICRRQSSGIAVLATIGSTGPFVGLFGTVWGIMRSFIGIADSHTTNLAVVAPGIAEALLATGMGLVAAIPAVVIYNAMSRSISSYRGLADEAVTLIMRHLSRELDRTHSSRPERITFSPVGLSVADVPLAVAE